MTLEGVVTTFATGFINSDALAFDAAGNFNSAHRRRSRPIDRQLSCDPEERQKGHGASGRVRNLQSRQFQRPISVSGFNIGKPAQVKILGLAGAGFRWRQFTRS